MVPDCTRALSRVRNVLILGCAVALGISPRADPAADRPSVRRAAPVLVLVRTGQLLREEVFPGATGPTPEAWDLVLTGTTWIAVESPVQESATTLASLRAALFPSATSLGGDRGEGPTLVDLADTSALPSEFLGDDRRKALPLRELETLFGAPEAPSRQEAAAISSLHRSLSASAGGSTPAVLRLAARARLHELTNAAVSLVRLCAKGASALDVARRDGVLATLSAVAGDQGHLLVLNIPDDGEASAFLRGPCVKSGQIVTRRVSLAQLAGLVEILRARPSSGSGAGVELGEALRDVLR